MQSMNRIPSDQFSVHINSLNMLHVSSQADVRHFIFQEKGEMDSITPTQKTLL